MHRQFEELCALAATGQISAEAMSLLAAHVPECESCRTFLQEIAPLRDHVGPILAAGHAPRSNPPEGIRERFLRRAAAAGLSLHPGPAGGPFGERPSLVGAAAESRSPQVRGNPVAHVRGWWAAVVPLAVPMGAALACGLLGYLLAQARMGAPPVRPAAAGIGAQVAGAPSPAMANEALAGRTIAQLEESRTQAEQRSNLLTAELGRVRADRRRLLAQLAEASNQAAAGNEYRRQFQAEEQALQDDETRIGALESDLRTARNEQVLAAADLSAQRQAYLEEGNRLSGVEAQLATAQAQVEQERRLDAAYASAKDLIAERNLHIVDIYDTTSGEQQRRPIGRVFYVEGRSLVFYAYDLPSSRRSSAKVSFHVWGETAGVQGATYHLGIMRSDGPGSRRWKLAFNDPKVLNHIDAVYLTEQPGNRDSPQGTKLMYAFLGTPNVP